MKLFRVILLSAFLCSTFFANAQEVRRFEGEVRIGLTAPVGSYHDGEPIIGSGFGVELRYNFPSSRWDCGLAFNITTAIRSFNIYDEGCHEYEQSNRSANFMLFGDYNLRQGSKVNPYFGCGIGFSANQAIYDVVYDSSYKSFAIQPRIGVELFRHLRVGVSLLINRKGYSNSELSLGFVLGGGLKK